LAEKQSFAEKRHKQSEFRRIRNRSAKSTARTYARTYMAAIHEKNASKAQEALRILVKELDTIARKGILPKNTAARKKSRMTKLYNVSFNASSAALNQ
jgi:small subunit ribosomal protein S20